ncbi:hypothetical protein [Nonomuraea aurantiaca]|uniref:hypothetical protein n=1 Tax=Nonomuraea aurantiaca TaxID=2878562 RepID=UPI001CD9A337|nr:hypothetical protein [Nonomuraea aurantiaca]MCA2228428.1 hypothetical protein [Nonomuraea aurantiaca]
MGQQLVDQTGVVGEFLLEVAAVSAPGSDDLSEVDGDAGQFRADGAADEGVAVEDP